MAMTCFTHTFLSYSIPGPPKVMVGFTEKDKKLEFSHITNEGNVPPSFSCFYSGRPSPNVIWTLASGEPLPSTIQQTHAKHGILQLWFTSSLAYDDPVWFVCTASNPLGTAMARLELDVRGEAKLERERGRKEGKCMCEILELNITYSESCLNFGTSC